MNIVVVGGGPAGLTFALLMKKTDPAHRVLVLERNAPTDTFGWGVVFSDQTMSYLRDSDEPTWREITRRFATWDNVDVVHRDRKISIHGNRFSGIARIELLGILQRRCEELGVELRHRTNVADLAALPAHDLLVGADGVNSLVRQARAAAFEPTLSPARNRYIWFGTPRLFHGLTLTFRSDPAGVFTAHSYKFDDRRSTFIVECAEETWARAGFERLDDAETRAYLERVFERDLEGQPLLSNASKWITFVTVRNRRWADRNVVLLGDALHTAHFSIGSGTKLALEDAIALERAFRGQGTVERALSEFERVRRPVVEELQAAACESLAWFEDAGSLVDLDPMELAYRLMTRSGRIDHENLRRRDPAFVAAYEQWRAAR
jgi:anthraniloyl-CoA monooxygenase